MQMALDIISTEVRNQNIHHESFVEIAFCVWSLVNPPLSCALAKRGRSNCRSQQVLFCVTDNDFPLCCLYPFISRSPNASQHHDDLIPWESARCTRWQTHLELIQPCGRGFTFAWDQFLKIHLCIYPRGCRGSSPKLLTFFTFIVRGLLEQSL